MCDCNDRVNEKLREHNTMLNCNFLDPEMTFVETIKIHSKIRGKPKMMAATFCPFCGEKYSGKLAYRFKGPSGPDDQRE